MIKLAMIIVSRAHALSQKEERSLDTAALQTSLHSAGMFAHQSNCLSHMAGPQECYYHVTISQRKRRCLLDSIEIAGICEGACAAVHPVQKPFSDGIP